MSSTIDSSLVQCIGQDTVETILLELAIPDFITVRVLSDSEFILKLNDYFLSRLPPRKIMDTIIAAISHYHFKPLVQDFKSETVSDFIQALIKYNQRLL